MTKKSISPSPTPTSSTNNILAPSPRLKLSPPRRELRRRRYRSFRLYLQSVRFCLHGGLGRENREIAHRCVQIRENPIQKKKSLIQTDKHNKVKINIRSTKSKRRTK